MTHAILTRETGGAEVLEYEAVEVGRPGPGEVRLRQTAVGVNFIDIYHRDGTSPVGDFPSGLGMEAAGVVEAVGEGVMEFDVGDRVAYASGPPGAYAEVRNHPAERLVPLPEGVTNEMAAAILLKGMTVEFLIRRAHAGQPGETVVLHAAAGGVGLLACQWLRHLGARVIGTVGSEKKAELARRHG